MPRGPKPQKPSPPWALILASRRVGLGLRQEDIAERTRDVINQTTVSDLERGKTNLQEMTYLRLTAYARALGWTVRELQEATGIYVGADNTDLTGEGGGVAVPHYGTVTAGHLNSTSPLGYRTFTARTVGDAPPSDLYALELDPDQLIEREAAVSLSGRADLLFHRGLTPGPQALIVNLWLPTEGIGTLTVWRPQRRPIVLESADGSARPVVIDESTPFTVQGVLIGFSTAR